MAPRLTAQQGVELLKIHQLRRENAAIYQQLQSLREAVSDIKYEHETFRSQTKRTSAEIKSIETSLLEKQKREDKLTSDVEMLFQGRDEIEASLADLKTKVEHRFDVAGQRHDQVENTVRDVRNETKELRKGHHLFGEEFRTAVNKLQDELAHKTEAVDLDNVQTRLAEVEDRLVGGHGDQTRVETVLVQQSTEDNVVQLETIRDPPIKSFSQHDHQCPISCSPDSLFDDPDKITETASYDESELTFKPQCKPISEVSLRSNELDLDECLNASRISHRVHLTSPNDSLVTIPYRKPTIQPVPINFSSTFIQRPANSSTESDPQSELDHNPTSPSPIPLPRTPHKQRLHRRDIRTQSNQNTSPSSPLLGKVFHTKNPAPALIHSNNTLPLLAASPPPQEHPKISKTQLNKRSIEYIPLSPSPYNPKPRLVPRKRQPPASAEDLVTTKPQSTARNSARDISTAAIPKALTKPRMSDRDKLPGERDQYLRKRKKVTKRVLPPPPEIPILFSSGELDKERFSRWHSPCGKVGRAS